MPSRLTDDEVSVELGRYFLSIRDRALETGHHQQFIDALISVLIHVFREGYEDDLRQIDDAIDRTAVNMKQSVRIAAANDPGNKAPAGTRLS